MPKKYIAFTDHQNYEIFGRITLKKVGEVSRKQFNLSTDFRLFLLGLQRMSNKGHAVFLPGEIVSLVKHTPDKPYSERYLRTQIQVLVNAKLLSPESNIRCLVYPMEVISLKTDKKMTPLCPEHGTHSSWSSENQSWARDSLPEVVVEPIPNQVEEVIHPDWEEEFQVISGSYTS